MLWGLVLIPALLTAQTAEQDVRRMAYAQAESEGIDPQELEARLQARGINTATLKMSDIPRVQPIVEEEIALMKAEQRANSGTKGAIESGSLSGTDMSKKGSEESIQTDTQQLAIESKAKVNPSVSSRVFGKNIFSNGSMELYEVSKDYIPNDSYILGPGDVVTVSIFGKSQADLQFTIKPDGFIEPENLPKIYLKGLSLGQGRNIVRRRLQNFYQFKKGQFALTLTTSRTLTIQITGAVGQPGTYTLSAYNTAFNALIAAGGPNKLGTVRNIQVINGGRVKELDVYEYLFNPKKQSDYYLQNNDILYVPFIGDLVEVKGSVKQVGVFEMKEKETFSDLLAYTGGYLSDALEDEIQLVRKNEAGSFVKEYRANELAKLTFEDGDKVIIATQTSNKKDYVEVTGWVDYPGIYGVRDYPTVKSLLQKAGIREQTRLDVAYLTRTKNDGKRQLIQFNPRAELAAPDSIAMTLLPEDQIALFNIRDFMDNASVSIEGAVRQPGTFAIDDNANVAYLIDLAKGLKQDAKLDLAYVFRKSTDGTATIETLNLEDVLSGTKIFELRDKDVLRVLSEKAFIDEAVISVSGEVRVPLEIPFDSAITLDEVLSLAGGLTFAGDSSKVIVYRISFAGKTIGQTKEYTLTNTENEDFVFKPFDAIVVRRKFGFEYQEYVTIGGEVAYPGRYIIKRSETASDLIEKAGGITNAAQLSGTHFRRNGKDIFVSLYRPQRLFTFYSDIELLPRDSIFIPKKDMTVTIYLANTASTNYTKFDERFSSKSITVAYVSNKNSKWYINNMAGGYGDNAKRHETNVIYANGVVKGYRWYNLIYRYPKVKSGSTIVVEGKKEKVKKEGVKLDMNQVVATMATTISTFATMYMLITR